MEPDTKAQIAAACFGLLYFIWEILKFRALRASELKAGRPVWLTGRNLPNGISWRKTSWLNRLEYGLPISWKYLLVFLLITISLSIKLTFEGLAQFHPLGMILQIPVTFFSMFLCIYGLWFVFYFLFLMIPMVLLYSKYSHNTSKSVIIWAFLP